MSIADIQRMMHHQDIDYEGYLIFLSHCQRFAPPSGSVSKPAAVPLQRAPVSLCIVLSCMSNGSTLFHITEYSFPIDEHNIEMRHWIQESHKKGTDLTRFNISRCRPSRKVTYLGKNYFRYYALSEII